MDAHISEYLHFKSISSGKSTEYWFEAETEYFTVRRESNRQVDKVILIFNDKVKLDICWSIASKFRTTYYDRENIQLSIIGPYMKIYLWSRTNVLMEICRELGIKNTTGTITKITNELNLDGITYKEIYIDQSGKPTNNK